MDFILFLSQFFNRLYLLISSLKYRCHPYYLLSLLLFFSQQTFLEFLENNFSFRTSSYFGQLQFLSQFEYPFLKIVNLLTVAYLLSLLDLLYPFFCFKLNLAELLLTVIVCFRNLFFQSLILLLHAIKLQFQYLRVSLIDFSLQPYRFHLQLRIFNTESFIFILKLLNCSFQLISFDLQSFFPFTVNFSQHLFMVLKLLTLLAFFQLIFICDFTQQ